MAIRGPTRPPRPKPILNPGAAVPIKPVAPVKPVGPAFPVRTRRITSIDRRPAGSTGIGGGP